MKKTLQKLTSILLTACLVMAVPMSASAVTEPGRLSGTSFTKVGIVLYDANWNSLKEKTFSVTNVSKATTSFHSWFDINKELGVTLKPSSKYYYRIWGYVDGVKIATPHWGFTTASK